ncbi:MAG TPA: tetratricopeptide repeat protein [Gemmataceae bacterium]|jgi:predicted Zn-dependent protease
MRERFRRLFSVRWGLPLLGLTAAGIALAVWYFRPDPRQAAAEEALQRRDYAGAYTLLQGCLQRRPDDARLQFLAGRTARRAGLYEEAAKHLRACQRIQGETPALTLEHALMRGQRGERQVEPYLQSRVAAGDPDTLLIWEVLIQMYLDDYRLFEARDCLDRYLERRPDDVVALLGRGHIWELLQHYPEAVRDYQRAVRAEPENDRARLRLAGALQITGPPQEAAEQFEWLRSHRPDDPVVRLGLARAWRQLGRLDEARQLLDDLLSDDARHVGALTERGRLALEEREPQRAAVWLRRAVELAPHNREALYNLSRCLQLTGPDAEARDCQTRFERADADLKSLAQLTKEVLRSPRDTTLRCKVGVILLNNGEEQEGVRWLQRVLREAPSYRPAHQALADYYQRSGNSERATDHRRMAEGAPPDSP